MTKKQKRRLKKLLLKAGKPVIFGTFGALMYYKSRIMPKYADDYPYSFKWDHRYGNLTTTDRKYERIKTLKDLIDSQIAHYKNWDGRVLADFMVQLNLIRDDKKYFDVANTLVMLAQLLICGSLGKGKISGLKRLSLKEVLLLTTGFWFCTPHLIATCFWLTGSVTYLWTGLIESLYVLPYAMHYFDSDISVPAPVAALMGLASGWSMKTGAGAALMLSGAELVRSWHNGKTAPWMISGVIGTCVGMTLLLAAPGNRVKFRLEKEMSDTLPKSFDDALPGYVPPEYVYTPRMFKLWFLQGFLPTVLRELPLQIPVFLYFRNKTGQTSETTKYILAMESAALAIPMVMMLSPEYPKRSTYHSVLYTLPASIKAMEHISIPPLSEWSDADKTVGKLTIGALAVNILASLIVDADLHCQMRDQVETIIQNKGKETIHVGSIGLSRLYSLLSGNRSVTLDVLMGICFEEKNDPYNRAAAAYYGADNIECEPYDKHRYYSNKPGDILFGITNPIKSLFRVTRELLRKDKWPSSEEAIKDDEQ